MQHMRQSLGVLKKIFVFRSETFRQLWTVLSLSNTTPTGQLCLVHQSRDLRRPGALSFLFLLQTSPSRSMLTSTKLALQPLINTVALAGGIKAPPSPAYFAAMS